MKKKTLTLLATGIIAIGTITGVAYAKGDGGNSNIKQEVKNSSYRQDCHTDMIKALRDKGYDDLAKKLENTDYKNMNDFMNTLSDEEYDIMTKAMDENGYGRMANMMRGRGRRGMSVMHNFMGSNRGCHGNWSSNNSSGVK
ncbi:hypothetical protein CLPU_31c00050 [Gottschalkia purinilytica]|uniref:DUF2680 domain-containing protein n=1 Tax=Gottschalkia purinilytica TaxID=1503 RepID=A0A0L0W672_GOTPU|nr:hypothetical protein [Gottschalkia purinilytica]KNF07028.1 hypothetical protein CLPU_31c00050 [Gottschalkia purinilytica]